MVLVMRANALHPGASLLLAGLLLRP